MCAYPIWNFDNDGESKSALYCGWCATAEYCVRRRHNLFLQPLAHPQMHRSAWSNVQWYRMDLVSSILDVAGVGCVKLLSLPHRRVFVSGRALPQISL